MIMKKMIYIFAASVAMLFAATDADAQMGKRLYVNGGWQFNGTLKNEVVQSAQGYGAYVEGGYFITPMIAVGGFASFNSNNQYYPTQTYTFADKSALTTDMSKSIYQVPFGSTLRVRLSRSIFQPYFETKVGAEYSTQSTYMSTFMSYDANWGFYISPEVGVTIFPFPKDDFGFHLAAYYSYSTNMSTTYDIKGLNNLGFKLGIAF